MYTLVRADEEEELVDDTFSHSLRAGIVFMAVLVSPLFLGACGTGAVSDNTAAPETAAEAKTIRDAETNSVQETTAEKEVATYEELQREALEKCAESGKDKLFAADVQSYADDFGVTYKEASQRMQLQDCFTRDSGGLEQQLKKNERDSFAGLWIQHEPEYRLVVFFTEDGREKIQPYIDGKPYASLVKVRSGAEATLVGLRAAQAKAGRIMDRSGIPADSAIDIMKNRAKVYVTDRRKAEDKMERAGLQLPEHVVLIEGDLSLPDS